MDLHILCLKRFEEVPDGAFFNRLPKFVARHGECFPIDNKRRLVAGEMSNLPPHPLPYIP
ncbi:MAG: hypothetical protein ACJASX_003909 [Limisphaerales bacterium]|jgi:hypothetical protein